MLSYVYVTLFFQAYNGIINLTMLPNFRIVVYSYSYKTAHILCYLRKLPALFSGICIVASATQAHLNLFCHAQVSLLLRTDTH